MKKFGMRDEEERGGAEVIRPTGKCNRQGCTHDANIALAAVFTPQGRPAVVPASDAVTHEWRLRSGYTLRGWIERCGYCYSIERLREERAEWASTHDRPHPIPNWGHAPYNAVRSPEEFMAHFGGRSVSDAIARGLTNVD